MNRKNLVRLALIVTAYAGILLYGQRVVPAGPKHDNGQSVTPAYEGWFPNADGSYSLLFGYLNRNYTESVDVQVGPDNKFEPGPADRGQPSHFPPRRAWGVFTVTVPKDFGSNKLTWTLTSNGETISIPASLDPLWVLEPMKDATNNTPPFLSFSEKGPFVQGPQGQSTSLTASVGAPLELPLWVADDANVAPGATAPRTPAVVSVEQIPWTRQRYVFQSAPCDPRSSIHRAAHHEISWKGYHDGDVYRTWRLCAPRYRQ